MTLNTLTVPEDSVLSKWHRGIFKLNHQITGGGRGGNLFNIDLGVLVAFGSFNISEKDTSIIDLNILSCPFMQMASEPCYTIRNILF